MIIKLILMVVLGFIAGFINVNAGGGSLLTLPALIFLGLPPAVANGTNRIAILIGAVSAVRNFKSKGLFDWKFGMLLSIPALTGAVIGAHAVISMPDKIFNIMLSCVMIAVVIIIIFKPTLHNQLNSKNLTIKMKLCASIAFFFIGLYGGFIQAGVGFVIIGALSFITGLSLVKINSLKVFVVAVFTVFSLSVFILQGKINLMYGIFLSIGSALGAHAGSSFAVKRGDKWIRRILIVTVIIMAIKLSGILNFAFAG